MLMTIQFPSETVSIIIPEDTSVDSVIFTATATDEDDDSISYQLLADITCSLSIL